MRDTTYLQIVEEPGIKDRLKKIADKRKTSVAKAGAECIEKGLAVVERSIAGKSK